MRVAAIAAVRKPLPILLLLVSVSAFAQSGVWGARGISHTFLPRGTQVFDIDGRGVTTYDVSTPSNPRVTSVTTTLWEARDGSFVDPNTIAVATPQGIDTFTVAANGTLTPLSHVDLSGLQHLRANSSWVVTAGGKSVNVFKPANGGLTLQQTFMTNSAVTALGLAGNALYVSTGTDGVTVVDLTGRSANTPLSEFTNDFAISGNTMAIASGVDGLVIADISNPLAPRVTGRVGAGAMNLATVAINGTRVYAGESPNVVRVFDITDPTAPQLVMQVNEPVQTIAASGSSVFVSGSTIDVFGIATQTGIPLRVLDGSTLAMTGTVSDLAGPVSGVATDGSLAYVVDPPRFRVIDISTTSQPRELASIPLNGNFDRAKVFEKQVILYGRGDVDLIDVSNPYEPRFVDVFHSLGRPPSTGAFTRNNIVEGNPWSGFHVMDFYDYTPPGQIGGLKGHYFEVVGDGTDSIYLSGEGSAIAALDLSDPKNPHATKVITIGAKQMAIVPANDAHPDLLLVRTPETVTVFSLADRLHPVEVGSVQVESSLIGAGDSGAYVVAGTSVLALDLTDAAHPALLPSAVTALAPMQIAVAGGKAVIADTYGLRVFGPNTAAPPPPPPPPHHRPARP